MNARTTGTVACFFAGAFWLVADGTAKGYPPVYVTVILHNEEPAGVRPDYTADVNYYLQNRALVKSLAETITSRGATYNFQSDWNYLKAVALYDVGSVTTNTNGKNIVRWMKEDLGVEIDPHAHETQYNYADVAYLIEQLGVTTSKNVGGFLYDPPDNEQGWEQHINGFYGWIYPSYFWRADHLWGAATYLHQGNDDKSSGVWRPKDRYNFYVDDPNQRLLYIGGGCAADAREAALMQLLDDIQAGRVPADGFYTANLIMIQDWMTPQSIAALGDFIDSLAPYVADGRVRWSTLSQTAQTWRTQYGSVPFRYDCIPVTPTAVLDFFYAVHIHVPNDYATPSQTEFNDITTTVSRMADILEAHGARGTFESVFKYAEAALLYQGAADNILKQLETRGHEVAAHAHNADMFQLGYDALVSAGVQNITTVGGRTVIPGDATTFGDTVELAANVGFTVLTDNWSPTDTFGGADWCSDFGLGGNTMYNETNNIMHPWRPDYSDICAHNPAGQVVYVDHAIPDWFIPPNPNPVGDANFNILKPWFEASLQYVDTQQVNAWGFVSHQTEYNYPGTWTVSEDSVAALDRFLTYVDGFVAQGSVRYATARGIAAQLVEPPPPPPPTNPLYVVVMTHVEGDAPMPEGDPGCPTTLFYQTLALPPTGQPAPGPTFSIDIRGTEMLRETFQNYHDSYASEPKLFIEPAGEFWQTEASATYGGKLFQTYDYQSLGYEFGIQGHAIYCSGQNFCWYNSAHTAEGVQRKLTDLHNVAQTVLRGGQPINGGDTLTGGWKLEQQALGATQAEYVIDHAAYNLGYRISFEDHDGHIEDEPAGINNARSSYYGYRADYGDGVQMIKIDFNGGVNASCTGNTPRCETPTEAIARFDATVAAKDADSDPSHVYYFAFTIHSNGVWADFNRAAGGQSMVGEGAGLLALMDAIEARKNAGTPIKYVTPSELAAIFEAANPPPPTGYTIESIETRVTAPNGNQVYTRIVQPVPALYPGQRFPALIAIPGGTGAGAPLADNPGYRNLAASGFIVVVFNPEGRGTGTPGNLRSQGTEDCNGYVHQDDLKAIVEYTASKTNVDTSNIGVETASFGIAIGAGAVGRYPDLPVKYLVDQEGPHDSRVITFYDVGREVAVCAHWSTVTDPSPANLAFWNEREAVNHIGGFRGMYLRMQAETDHAQGPGYFRHTIEMVNAATAPAYGGTGSACWTRVNGTDIGNPINTVYPLNDPSQYPVWVTGRLSDHPGLNLEYDREMSALSCPAGSAPIPTLSEWGLVTLTILLMTAGTVVIRRTRFATLPPTTATPTATWTSTTSMPLLRC